MSLAALAGNYPDRMNRNSVQRVGTVLAIAVAFVGASISDTPARATAGGAISVKAFTLSGFKQSAPPLAHAFKVASTTRSTPKALAAAQKSLAGWLDSHQARTDTHTVATAWWVDGRLELLLGKLDAARGRLAALRARGSSLADSLAADIAAHPSATNADWQALVATSGHAPSFESSCRQGAKKLVANGKTKEACEALTETLLQPMPTWRRRRLMRFQATVFSDAGDMEASARMRSAEWWRFGTSKSAPSVDARWARRVFHVRGSKSIAKLIKELESAKVTASAEAGDVAASSQTDVDGGRKDRFSAEFRDVLLGVLKTHSKHTRAAGSAEILKHVERLASDVALQPYLLWASAVALRSVDRDLEAASVYREIATVAPDHPMVDHTTREAAWLFLRRGLPTDAQALYDTLADSGRWGAPNRDALWHSGIHRFMVGDFDGAVSRFEPLVARYGGQLEGYGLTWAERGGYWRARALEAGGQLPQALAAYESLARAFPMSWYGTLARGRVRDMAVAGHIPAFTPVGELLAAARSRRPSRLARHPRKLLIAQRPALDRAVAMYRFGRFKQAKSALDNLAKARQLYDTGRALLAEVLRQTGDVEGATRSLLNRGLWAKAPEDIDANWLREMFPMPYRKHIQRVSKTNRYEMAFLTGIIHVESRFSPTVKSGAGAIGLTQLMTRTARSVSRNLLGRSLKKKQLYNPKINLEIGSRFLRELYEHFGRNPALAAAAYNAGHGAVRGWLKRRGHLPTDLWVELIPYDQTRNYVRRVVTMGEMYRRLHQLPGGRLRVPEHLPVSLGPFFEEKESVTQNRVRPWGKGTISTGLKRARTKRSKLKPGKRGKRGRKAIRKGRRGGKKSLKRRNRRNRKAGRKSTRGKRRSR